jgi:hypothetical protein
MIIKNKMGTGADPEESGLRIKFTLPYFIFTGRDERGSIA